MLLDFERLILKAYLNLPASSMLDHARELEESYLAGIVCRFLKGERFNEQFIAFTDEEMQSISALISDNPENQDGRDLRTIVFVTQATCNILNKYMKAT